MHGPRSSSRPARQPAPDGVGENVRALHVPGSNVFGLRACALGVARGEFVAVLEDHIAVGDEWCTEVIAGFDRNPRADAIIGGITNGAPRCFDRASFLLTFALFLAPLDHVPRHRCPVPGIIAFRAAVLPRTPPAPGYLEFELPARLRDEGRLVAVASLRVEHVQRVGSRGFALQFHAGASYAGLNNLSVSARPRARAATRRDAPAPPAGRSVSRRSGVGRRRRDPPLPRRGRGDGGRQRPRPAGRHRPAVGRPEPRAPRIVPRPAGYVIMRSAKRRSRSIFSSSGWVSGSTVYGHRKPTIASVTPASSSRRTPSGVYASIDTAWISNGSRSRPHSARSCCTRGIIAGELAGVATRMDPAVASLRGAAQRGRGVAADEDRDRSCRDRRDLAAVELPQLAVVFEPAAGREAAHDVDRLVHTRAALLPRQAHRREVLGPRADADTETQPVVAEHRDARRLLRDQHRRADRELHDERREAQPARLRGEERDERERLDDRLVLEERAVAVGGVRIPRVGVRGEQHAVGDDERVESRVLGRAGQRREVRGIAEGLGVAESHAGRLAIDQPRGQVAGSRPAPGSGTGAAPVRS